MTIEAKGCRTRVSSAFRTRGQTWAVSGRSAMTRAIGDDPWVPAVLLIAVSLVSGPSGG